MQQEPVLKVEDLAICFKTYRGTIQAVRRVDFEIGTGEVLGIVGESGCGKSVTAHAIMRLLPKENSYISHGKITMNGTDLLSLSEQNMQSIRGNDIGMIFQDPMTSLNPVLTIGTQLTESLVLHKKLTKQEAKKKSIEMLKLVGIPNPENRLKDYPHQFSGGMRQRVMIAMALACSPKLIIADECISALDVSIQAQVVNLMKDIQKETGTTYLFIAHDLSMVKYISERIGVLHMGHLVETGTTEEIFSHPVHPYTRSLISAIPNPNPVVERSRIALHYDYKTSGLDYGAGTMHQIEGTHFVRGTDADLEKWV